MRQKIKGIRRTSELQIPESEQHRIEVYLQQDRELNAYKGRVKSNYQKVNNTEHSGYGDE